MLAKAGSFCRVNVSGCQFSWSLTYAAALRIMSIAGYLTRVMNTPLALSNKPGVSVFECIKEQPMLVLRRIGIYCAQTYFLPWLALRQS